MNPYHSHVSTFTAIYCMGSIPCVYDLFAPRTLSPPPSTYIHCLGSIHSMDPHHTHVPTFTVFSSFTAWAQFTVFTSTIYLHSLCSLHSLCGFNSLCGVPTTNIHCVPAWSPFPVWITFLHLHHHPPI